MSNTSVAFPKKTNRKRMQKKNENDFGLGFGVGFVKAWVQLLWMAINSKNNKTILVIQH